jgi:hypothetical protein
VKLALNGVQSLVDVTTPTDPNVLARSWVPANSPYLAKITADEGHNGMYATTYNGQQVYWIGSTSRDQYAGIFFGLAVAYDFVADSTLRAQMATLVTRLLDNLISSPRDLRSRRSTATRTASCVNALRSNRTHTST